QKQIGTAMLAFHTFKERLPPGYLGPKDQTKKVDSSGLPLLGSMAFILPQLEQEALYNQIKVNTNYRQVTSTSNGEWFKNNPTYAAAQTKLGVMLCPSGLAENNGKQTIVAIHTSTAVGNPPLEILALGLSSGGTPIGRSNYVGCAGRPTVANWQGVYGDRSNTSLADIKDGSGNTILFGESAGGWNGSIHEESHSWMGSGALPAEWGLGSAHGSVKDPRSVLKFSSNHSGVVLFTFADNSVKSIPITVNLGVFHALSGMSDGQVVSLP
ncbi:MAG: DUF1559 domain-containing protein, partial [Planctomycetaceae bacterium]|nr:DUF1559 domain-containing protein [Planctomycetaceae bacterium]